MRRLRSGELKSKGWSKGDCWGVGSEELGSRGLKLGGLGSGVLGLVKLGSGRLKSGGVASKGLGSGELKSGSWGWGSWIRGVREVRDRGNCCQGGWGWRVEVQNRDTTLLPIFSRSPRLSHISSHTSSHPPL